MADHMTERLTTKQLLKAAGFEIERQRGEIAIYRAAVYRIMCDVNDLYNRMMRNPIPTERDDGR